MIKISLLYLLFIIEFLIIAISMAAYIFFLYRKQKAELASLKGKRDELERLLAERMAQEENRNEGNDKTGEEDEKESEILQKRISDLEKELEEKTLAYEDMKKNYELIEKEYFALYHEQQKTGG